MEYRNLGRSGLKVSALSFGSWVTFKNQLDTSLAKSCIKEAFDSGVNFFDNAEIYAKGNSEVIMCEAMRELGIPRHAYVISTKFFWGIHDAPNMKNTLNRKYLMQAMDASLGRMKLDFVDLVFCHRSDPSTPVEETVYAMHDIISSGKALYWGTSEWPATMIAEAWDIADKRNLHKPVMEQPEYHLLSRTRVEKEYAPLYEKMGLGLTTWSPLASGVLTGKYIDGVPENSRATLKGFEWLQGGLTDPAVNAKVKGLRGIAEKLDCTLAQLAIAWCAKNPRVSTVITGASSVEQVKENLKALKIVSKLTPDVLKTIDAAIA